MKTPDEIYELGKKEVSYDRQLAVLGKEKADAVLYFWIQGYEYSQEINAVLLKPYRLNGPWPLKDMLQKLIQATDILLIDKSYDGATYEEMQMCSKFAKEVLMDIEKAQEKVLN